MLESFSGPLNSVKMSLPSSFTPRRRRVHLSSQTNEIQVQGQTYLCFPTDHSWFQGNVNTDDDSSYSLYGERVASDPFIINRTPRVSSSSSFSDSDSDNKSEDNNNSEDDKDLINNGHANGNNSKDLSDDLSSVDCFRVTLTDHFTGLSYHLPKIGINLKGNLTTGEKEARLNTNLFRSNGAEVKFHVENVYKGQKADMVLQKCLGASSLLGKKCLVYSGPISIHFNEVIGNGRSWCL